MYYSSKKVLKKIILATNIINYFWRNLPNGVYVFNYHRIGDADKSQFDRAVFSCDKQAFEQQIIELKSHFKIINTVELARLIECDEIASDRFAVLTFDDGYLDNYSEALPILIKHKVSGVFYLTTEYLEPNKITWWDEIAYILRKSHGMKYQGSNNALQYNLNKDDIDKVIQRVLTDIKLIKNLSIVDVLEEIRAKFPLARKELLSEEHQLFMGWKEAKDLVVQGMEIGSHTLTHPILSQLDAVQHKKEIVDSKLILEERLNCEINSIAYPVGRYYCYNQKSFEYSVSAGYKIGFNNELGFHRSISNSLDINRFSVSTNDINYLKYECCFT
jgi:peptidoglycan/xylan/chitin deacetylase (PgdA/CDA1 family)